MNEVRKRGNQVIAPMRSDFGRGPARLTLALLLLLCCAEARAGDPIRPDYGPEPYPDREAKSAFGTEAENPREIDLLIVYTARGASLDGGIDRHIDQLIEHTHRYYRNSLIHTRLRVVHRHQTSYDELEDGIADGGRDLERLIAPDDGFMDEVHELRDQYGADIVHLLTNVYSPPLSRLCCDGRAALYHNDPRFEAWAMSVSQITDHPLCEPPPMSFCFAHEIGHVLGADHSPLTGHGPAPKPYGHGYCSEQGGWFTIMSYSIGGVCDDFGIAHFSNPNVVFEGLATGDWDQHNVARAINENTPEIAAIRPTRVEQLQRRYTVPFLPSADATPMGVVQIVNRGSLRHGHYDELTGTVRIRAFDDTGTEFGPIEFDMGPGTQYPGTQYFNSHDLEHGNPSKGIPRGVGDGTGSWWLELESDLALEVSAYAQLAGSVLVPIHDVVAPFDALNGGNFPEGKFRVWLFNPARNQGRASFLRIVNMGAEPTDIVISVTHDSAHVTWDDELGFRNSWLLGTQSLDGRSAIHISAQDVEDHLERTRSWDHPAPVGRPGKWRLEIRTRESDPARDALYTPVIEDRSIAVMNLMRSPNGHLSNLSATSLQFQ